MYAESDLVMISTLQHYLFCNRQCALIHLENQWDENRLTAEGRVLHKSVDQAKNESRRDVRTVTSLRLRSLRLGLTGVADRVEFHQKAAATDETGHVTATSLMNVSGLWAPFPIEYKRGRPKEHSADKVQLCAQALCLEEMLSVHIPVGALFYGETRRRADVLFDAPLRAETEATCLAVQQLFAEGVTPPALYNKRCESCSLIGTCLPGSAGSGKSAKKWLAGQIDELCIASDKGKATFDARPTTLGNPPECRVP